MLDANRDFGVQLALEPEISTMAPQASLWLVFADDGEAQLAREAWPGKAYAAATSTSIAAAVSAQGDEPLMPMGAGAATLLAGLGSIFGGGGAPPPAAPPPPAALQLVVQPGDGGPMEDWLNLELLRREGTPMLCLNGALDKVTSGYYSNFLNPNLAACAERFFSKFEPVYYLKPIGSGRGWLFRVYPEAWQCAPTAAGRRPPLGCQRQMQLVAMRCEPTCVHAPRAGSTAPRGTRWSSLRPTRSGQARRRASIGSKCRDKV